MDPQFAGLITQLLSADNEQRKAAEALFEQCKQQPEMCAINLLAAMRQAPDIEHRSFAAIMLRKVGVGVGCVVEGVEKAKTASPH